MAERRLLILHLEDDAVDAELIQDRLGADGLDAEWVRVRTREDYLAALQQNSLDLILADYSLPGFDGLSALALAQELDPDVPFIFVTGALGEEKAIETLRNGATDYVLKNRLSRLAPAVRRAWREAEERRERWRAEAAVHAEREWLRVTLASIGDAVIATDTQGRITFMNAVAEAITGWPQTEAIGQPIDKVFNIINEYTRLGVESPVSRVIREGGVAGLANNTLLITKTGEEIPIDDSGAPIRDSKGWLIGVVLVFRDIRARRQAEEALRESEARYRRIVETANEGIWLIDTQARTLFANQRMADMLGTRPDEMLGRPVLDFTFESDQPEAETRIKRSLGGATDQFDFRFRRGDGTPVLVLGGTSPVTNARGDVVGMLGMYSDITARKQAEAALESRVRQQAVVAKLGQRALVGLDVSALMSEAVVDVADTLGVEMSKVLELLPDGQALRVRAGVGWREGVVGQALVEASPRSQAGYTLASKSPVIVTDLKHETRFVGMPILHGHGVVSGITVIIPGSERPYGVLGAHTARVHVFTPDDINFLQAVANVLGEALARHSVEAALLVSRDQLAAILGGIAEGVTVQDPMGQVIYANDTAAQVMGFPSAEVLLGTPLQQIMERFEVLTDDGHPFPIAELPGRRALLGEPNPSALIRFRVRSTGDERWAKVNARPIFNAQGKVERAVNIFADITGIKRAEIAQRLLADAGRVLASPLDYQTRLTNIAEVVVPALADWCVVDMVDQDGALNQVAVSHVNPAKVPWVRQLRRQYPPSLDEMHPILRVMRTGQPDFAPQITDEQLQARARDAEHLELLRVLGIRSHLVLPLIARGRTLGAISFVLGQSGRHYDAEDLALAEELARRVALALDNALLYAEAQQLNADLEARVHARTEELEVILEELRITNIELENEVAERRQAEEKIRQSERWLADAQQTAQLGSWHWDIATDTVTWSDELYRIYGLDPENFAATYEGFLEHVHPDDREFVRRRIDQAYRDHRPFTFDHRIIRPDESVRTLHARGEVILDATGELVAMSGTGQDITERKQMEEELRESREQLRQLSAHLQAAREEERKHIAREIHDQLGGSLTALKMDVIQLQRGAKAVTPDKLIERTRTIAQTIDATIQTVRRIATDLRPGILDDFGLVAAIEWQLQEFQTRSGIQSNLISQVDEISLDPDSSTAVFRVFQETLTNVARHAQATQVDVTLEKSDDHLMLQVRDNGRGISPRDVVGSHSLGLLGMRERIYLLAGELEIKGTPGQGTVVLVKVPLGKIPDVSSELTLGDGRT